MGNFLLHVYMSDCQHDKSDRCYFYIFKNKFVVYSFLFLLCRAIFKLTQVDTFTVINYEMSVFSQMVWQSSESQNSVGKTLKGTDSLCFALKVSIYSFNVDSAAVSADIFYIKDRPKSTHQSSKIWKRVRLSTSTLWAYNKWIDFLKLSAHVKCWYLPL